MSSPDEAPRGQPRHGKEYQDFHYHDEDESLPADDDEGPRRPRPPLRGKPPRRPPPRRYYDED